MWYITRCGISHDELEKAVQNYCLFPTWQKESTIFLSLCFLYRLESEIDIYFNFIRTKRLVSVFGRFLFFIFSVMRFNRTLLFGNKLYSLL